MKRRREARVLLHILPGAAFGRGAKIPSERARGDPEFVGDILHAGVLVLDGGECVGDLAWFQCGGSAELFAADARCEETGARALADDGAFKLGERGHHMEHEAASRGGRVNIFHDGPKVDPLPTELIDQRNEAGKRSSKAVEPPDNQCIPWLQPP